MNDRGALRCNELRMYRYYPAAAACARNMNALARFLSLPNSDPVLVRRCRRASLRLPRELVPVPTGAVAFGIVSEGAQMAANKAAVASYTQWRQGALKVDFLYQRAPALAPKTNYIYHCALIQCKA